jgi:hypothetical protein
MNIEWTAKAIKQLEKFRNNQLKQKGTSKNPMGRRSGGRGCEKQHVTH